MKYLLLLCALLAPSAWGAGPEGVAATPYWVLNPFKPGYLSVVGSAGKQDWGGRDAQRRVALMKARQELAQMIRVKVTSSTQARTEDRDGKIVRDASIETSLQSNVDLKLDAAQVVEEWVDPNTGNLYLWLTTPE